MISRGKLTDRLPAPLSLRLRSARSVRRLFGMHAPTDLILGLVPRGRNAVDVGANRGVYTCWMAKRAVAVDAFEPQPALADYIRRAHLRNVRVFETALSDHEGSARFLVPADDGQARLASVDRDAAMLPIAERDLEVKEELGVQMRTLDSFRLQDVGFLKIDVEGHELAVLRGAAETIARCRPVIFVESEARHAVGAPGNVVELIMGRHRYRRAAFVRRWSTVDIGSFDLERDQLQILPDYFNPDYVGNFVFWPS